MAAAKRSPARSILAEPSLHRRAGRRRSNSSEIKAEIEVLKKNIERKLIELHAQADRLVAKDG